MISIFISGLTSALLLLLLSFIPDLGFFNVYVGGNFLNIVVLAVVIGLLTAFVGPALKKIFNRSNPTVQFVATLIIDALVLKIAVWLPFGNFHVDWISAIIAGAVLAAVGTVITSRMERRRS